MAFSIMLTDRGAFHPSLLASFIATIGLYPPGNRVRISNGAKGVVVSVGEAIDRPVVRITYDPSGAEIPEDDQYLLELSARKNHSLEIDELLLAESLDD